MNQPPVQNPFLAPDNVNLIMNKVKECLPQSNYDFSALHSFMQQVAQNYQLTPGIDPRQYTGQLNLYTLKALATAAGQPNFNFQGVLGVAGSPMGFQGGPGGGPPGNFQGGNQGGPGNFPGGNQGGNQGDSRFSEISANAQKMGDLVDKLKRERNYSQPQVAGMPPQRSFSDPQESKEEVLNHIQNKIAAERDLNHSLGGGSIRSVNLHEVIGSNPPQFQNDNNQMLSGMSGSSTTSAGMSDNGLNGLNGLSGLSDLSDLNGSLIGPVSIDNHLTSNKFLSLDFRTDVVDIDHQEYVFKFPEIRSAKRLDLVSVNLLRQPILENQPYLYISIRSREIDLNQSLLTGKNNRRFFGKLIPQTKSFNDYLNYQLDANSSAVNLPNNWNLNQLQISFYDYRCQPLDLKKIPVQQIIRLNKTQIQLQTPEVHHLRVGETLLMTQKRDHSYQAHSNRVVQILSDRSLIAQYQSNTLNHLTISRPQIQGHITLRLVA